MSDYKTYISAQSGKPFCYHAYTNLGAALCHLPELRARFPKHNVKGYDPKGFDIEETGESYWEAYDEHRTHS